MGDSSFHHQKAGEFLKSIKAHIKNQHIEEVISSLCLNVFYLGLHVIDWYLAKKGIIEVDNHGDRSNKLRKLNSNLHDIWKSFFSISNDQRYDSLTEIDHLKRLLEDLEEITYIISLEFPDFYQLYSEIHEVIENLWEIFSSKLQN